MDVGRGISHWTAKYNRTRMAPLIRRLRNEGRVLPACAGVPGSAGLTAGGVVSMRPSYSTADPRRAAADRRDTGWHGKAPLV
jgi:hypothetical protein